MLLIDIYVTGFDPIASGLLAVYCLHRQLPSKLEWNLKSEWFWTLFVK